MIKITWSETYEAWLLVVDGCEIQTAETIEELTELAEQYKEGGQ